MLLRGIAAFVALPGVVAFAIPLAWLVLNENLRPVHPSGFLLLASGTLALLACVREFHVAGHGTLAPWDPPRALVRSGLFRHTRNPMYVCVALVLLGWAAAYASWTLLAYAAVVIIGFHLRVVLAEEPWLERTYGEQWRQYSKSVPRWLLR
jgi:protein-S-isoprenylcysteine O-methyltransferase Ste14